MPTYRALDFSVRLHVWDPQKEPAVVDDRAIPSDPSIGHQIDEVTEEYFKDREGVNFLGDSPFFLLNAGRDLFFQKPEESEALDGCKDVHPREIEDEPLPALGQAAPPITPLKPKSVLDATQGGIQSNESSPLTSVPTDFDSSPLAFDSALRETVVANLRADGAPRGWLHVAGTPQLTRDIVRKPLRKPIPIKIQCHFGKKSFARSLNTDEPQDLCVNIFYNGEFVASKTYRFLTMRAATALEKQPNYAGRRVRSGCEVPFMLMPLSEGLEKVSNNSTGTDLADRWNKINALLLVEADQWGRSGTCDKFRSPVGKYLEDLSRLEIPTDMTKGRADGRNIGIIDVVVALGRAAVSPISVKLRNPQRPSVTLVPIEERSALVHRILAGLRQKPIQMPHNANDIGASASAGLGSVKDMPSMRSRMVTRKAARVNAPVSSPDSDEEYHISILENPGPKRGSTVNKSSRADLPSLDMSHSAAIASEPRKRADNRDVANDLQKKRHRDASPESEREAKRRKTRPVVEVPEFSGDRTAFVMTPERPSSQNPVVETNNRPVRQKVKKTHFDDVSPTPSRTKSQNSKEIQTPTPGSEVQDSPSSHTRGSTGSRNYKFKIFGMDGTANDPFTFEFGLDGSGSGSKRATQPSKSNRKASSSKGAAAQKIPNSTLNVFGTPTTSASVEEARTMMYSANSLAHTANQTQEYDLPSMNVSQQRGDAAELLSLPTKPKPRTISTGELKGLLGSYEVNDEIHNNLGSSFTNASINRSTRSAKRKGKEEVTKRPDSEVIESPSSDLKAIVLSGRELIVKGFTPEQWKKVEQPLVKPAPKITPQSKKCKAPPAALTSSSEKKKKRTENEKLHDKLKQASANAASPPVVRKFRTFPHLNNAASATAAQTNQAYGPHLNNAATATATQTNQAPQIEESSEDETSPSVANTSRDFSMTLRHPRRSASTATQATLPLPPPIMNSELISVRTSGKTTETPILPSSGSSRHALLETPSMTTQAVSLKKASGAAAFRETSSNNKSATSRRPKPNLVIQTGKANKDFQAALSSPLTTRTYVHTKEGRKAPTPKSGTFPDIKKTPTTSNAPTPTDDGFFFHSFVPPSQPPSKPIRQSSTRLRSSSHVEMLPTASVTSLSNATPQEGNKISRLSRARPATTSSPPPSMGPPPRTLSNTKLPAAAPFEFRSSTIKNDLTSPLILQSTKPYSARIAAAQSQKPAVNSAKNLRSTRRSATRTESIEQAESSTSVPVASSSRQQQPVIQQPDWKPVDLCTDSVLSYATKEQVGKWFRLELEDKDELPTRITRPEGGGTFRGHSILMGVRYVFGADFDVKGKGKEV